MKRMKGGRASLILLNAKEAQRRERRHFPRVILRRTITYEGPGLPTQPHFLSGKQSRGVLLNISSGGICLKGKYRLKRKLVLKVNLPLNETTSVVPTLAEVVRLKKGPKHKEYLVGLKFII